MREAIRIFILALVLWLPLHSCAQSTGFFTADEERTFYGGAVLGANFSTVQGDGYGGYHKVGLNAGGIVCARILPKILASVELLYTQKGSRGVNQTESAYTGTTIDKYFLDLNYVEVPVMLQYVVNARWRIGLGGAYAQLIKSNEEIITAQYYYKNVPGTDFHKRDYNLLLGGGVQFGSGIFLEGRYQFSLSSIRDVNNIPPYMFAGGAGQFNNFFTLKLMYLIK